MLKKERPQSMEKKGSEKNETSPRKFPSYAEIEAEKMKSY